MPDLIVDHVTKSYPTSSSPLVVLRDASLSLSRGENAAIVGPSGSGKSTLLHIVGTLDSPTSGTVSIAGEDPSTLNENALAAFRNKQVGFVFQEHYLLPQLTVLENTLIPAMAHGSPSADAISRAKQLLEGVGLTPRLAHHPSELSGGERQRVAVARALLNRPALLLADEPTGSLDRTSAHTVAKMLLELQAAEQAMLIVVTHSSEIAALFRRRYSIEDGNLKDC